MTRDEIMKAAEHYKALLEDCKNPIPEHLFTAEKALIAAAELLKQVEVLPEGSEPIVGDLLISTKGSMGGISCGYLFAKNWVVPNSDADVEADKTHWTITPRFGDGSQINKHWANPKEWQTIIQRNGKPVIIEKEGV